ncbi:MAG: hypothetical protein L3J97_04195, partial [Thermoplasmata archaeon]|nr:hypothetical protein [Thermoplasmata archaeon]
LGPAGGDAPRESTAPWIEWCASKGVALELTAQGVEDGLDAAGARRAHEAGVVLVLSAGSGTLSELELAAGRARRAWIPVEGVLNSRADAAGASVPKGPPRKRPPPGAGS